MNLKNIYRQAIHDELIDFDKMYRKNFEICRELLEDKKRIEEERRDLPFLAKLIPSGYIEYRRQMKTVNASITNYSSLLYEIDRRAEKSQKELDTLTLSKLEREGK